MTRRENTAHAPETVEGWYALHQVFRATDESRRDGEHLPILVSTKQGDSHTNGWTGLVQLIGSRGDVMLIHFYPTIESIHEAQTRYARLLCEAAAGGVQFDLLYSFLSVTEAGLYHITAQLAADAEARGGSVGDEIYRATMADRVRDEVASDHIRKRLYPQPPKDMPYVSFYPMSKRRTPEQNWYTLSLEERSRLMQSHGMTGRRYAGRVQQVITGAIGLDAWEWGVTLFAKDPIDFKKLVTDMRFDEVSAKYADFGEFFVGKLMAIL